MNDLSINPADLVIAGVLLLSGVLAFFRGAVRELLSVAGWVGAAAATYYGFGYLQPLARELIGMALLADIAAGSAIFVVSLIAISMASSVISRHVKESGLGAVDRSLGFVFGLARGALLVCIAYVMIAWALLPDEQPNWLREAKALPLVEYGAGLVLLAIPPEARSEWSNVIGQAELRTKDAFDAERALETLMNPPPAPRQGNAPGYSSSDRKKLDQLFQGNE